ncbi:hypothetical protein [Wenzhouxiangella sediminis]|uniref:Uncharacterized protein n=1 Tax=Wenzhouxiangella sediminis TaxID=1792836 RepID=A0A3E1KAA5_9GAMM|nr:hypothetical protein [Wenzhouxiangella sediminis]RFF31230.1 hypothetical protein DZC52_05280 [Wenzhouxiangella sediminis]
MKAFAIFLITAGFILGAVFAVLSVETVDWLPYGLSLFLGFAGIVLFRKAKYAGAADEHHVAGNIDTLQTSLDSICRNLDELVGRREKVPPHEFRFEIDRHFRNDLTAFAASRESMQHAFGLQAYADIMSAFAAGERYINRVWTASADGYVDEVMAYLEKAQRQFAEAREAFAAQRG